MLKKTQIKYYINSPKDSNLCGSSSLQVELLAVWQLMSLRRVSNTLRVLPWQLLPRHQDSNSAIMHIIVEDDQGKAIAWHLVSCKMTWYHVSDEKLYKFSVCILYSVCSLHFVTSLHFVPGQQSAVWILYWPDWYCCFCSSEPQVRTVRKKFLVRLPWPLWLMCGLYVEELPGKMSNDYCIPIEDER